MIDIGCDIQHQEKSWTNIENPAIYRISAIPERKILMLELVRKRSMISRNLMKLGGIIVSWNFMPLRLQ
jgi:hypothetical protein